MWGFSGFSPCPIFDIQSVWVPMVMALVGVMEFAVWGLSGVVSVWSIDDMFFLFGEQNLFVICCSNVLMLGLFLVQTFTKSGLIENDCFELRKWLKAFGLFCYCSLVCISSFCAGIFAAILLDEILSALFNINLNESIKLMTKFLSSLDIGIAAEVGCLLK